MQEDGDVTGALERASRRPREDIWSACGMHMRMDVIGVSTLVMLLPLRDSWSVSGIPQVFSFSSRSPTHHNASSFFTSLSSYLFLCFRYAHENGCPWTAQTSDQAALGGHLECLRYV